MFEVCLAGKISGLGYDDAMDKRLEFFDKANAIGIKCRSPLRGKSWLKNESIINEETVKKRLTLQEIILRDLHDIDRCNVVIILTGNEPSWGTGMEFAYAVLVAKKPVLVIADKYMGGWLDYYATKIVPNIDEAIEVLKYWKDYWDDGLKVYNVD